MARVHAARKNSFSHTLTYQYRGMKRFQFNLPILFLLTAVIAASVNLYLDIDRSAALRRWSPPPLPYNTPMPPLLTRQPPGAGTGLWLSKTTDQPGGRHH